MFDMSEFTDPKTRKPPETDAEKERKRRMEVQRRELKNLENKIERGLTLSGPELRRRKELEEALVIDEDPQLPDGVVRSAREVGEFFGRSLRTVRYWASKGMPRRADGYDLAAIGLWAMDLGLIDKVPPLKGSDVIDPANPVVVSEKTLWETEYRKIQAQLKQIELDKAHGRLIAIEEVEAGRLARIMAVKREMLAVPRTLAPQLIGLEAREIEAMLTEKMRDICRRFAEGGA